MNRLNIVSEEVGSSKPAKASSKTEAQARFERLWLKEPEKFDTGRSAMERLRIERTKAFLERLFPVKNAVDLGVGDGVIARFLVGKGVEVTGVDVAKNALKRLEGTERLVLKQDYVPYTSLDDGAFDLVISTDLIGSLPKQEYRLFVSELVRLSSKEGRIVCSTPIDVHTDGGLDLFVSLLETEIELEEGEYSYHRLSIRILEVLEKIKLTWLSGWLKQSRGFLLGCEKLSRMIWQKDGISHVIFRGKKKPIMPLPPKDEQPIEHKGKRATWE
jgi:2-polyprenyl-3-methyl-5-hydroxy-6-metoxy-1,4-benzoquinol methylase